MDGLRAHDVGTVRPADTLGDVLVLFKAAREWTIDVDEQLRAQGVQPMGATLGMPVAQLDALILILEREMQVAAVDAALRRSYRTARLIMFVCAGANLTLLAWRALVWWF